jgi:hypothetical protein
VLTSMLLVLVQSQSTKSQGAERAVRSMPEVVYSQPLIGVSMASSVFTNPTPWPRQPANKTGMVFWQRGALRPNSPVLTPHVIYKLHIEYTTNFWNCGVSTWRGGHVRTHVRASRSLTHTRLPGRLSHVSRRYPADLSAWTALRVPATEQAATSVATSQPWSAVQYTAGGVWGAALNTTGADPTTEHLTTTTLETSFGRCIPIWGSGGGDGVNLSDATTTGAGADAGTGAATSGNLEVELDFAVPFGFKLRPTNNSCAVYDC